MSNTRTISKLLICLMLIAATTIPAAAVKFPGCTNDARDINKDNLCEDINGNGILDFDDVVVFYQNIGNVRFWGSNFLEINHFNFDGKWTGFFGINQGDVVALYDKL